MIVMGSISADTRFCR